MHLVNDRWWDQSWAKRRCRKYRLAGTAVGALGLAAYGFSTCRTQAVSGPQSPQLARQCGGLCVQVPLCGPSMSLFRFCVLSRLTFAKVVQIRVAGVTNLVP